MFTECGPCRVNKMKEGALGAWLQVGREETIQKITCWRGNSEHTWEHNLFCLFTQALFSFPTVAHTQAINFTTRSRESW